MFEDHPTFERVGASGTPYWIDIYPLWDNWENPGGVLRMRGSICGGGIDYQVPICEDFLKAPDGTLVGE